MRKKPSAEEAKTLLLRPVLVVGCCFFTGCYCVSILQRPRRVSDEIHIEENNIRLCDTLEYAKSGTMEAEMKKLFDL